MAELATATATVTAGEVYSPAVPGDARTLQVWRTLVSWLGFLFQLLLQILRSTPTLAQALSFSGGGGHRSILFSSASPSFRPLPVDEASRPAPPADPSLPKLTIVLDLDETLVCAYETSGLPEVVRRHAIEAGVKCFELECLSVENDIEGKPKVSHVTMFERPGLREFLKEISEFADLILFTAGLEGYASPLVDRIDVDKTFSLRLYRPSTVSTEYREHVKDLSCISKDLCRIVIVDNNPFSFLLQPLNGIPCVPFSAGQPHDEQLMRVLLPLLKHLSFQKDVRPALYENFHMPEWFHQHGIPTSDDTCVLGS